LKDTSEVGDAKLSSFVDEGESRAFTSCSKSDFPELEASFPGGKGVITLASSEVVDGAGLWLVDGDDEVLAAGTVESEEVGVILSWLEGEGTRAWHLIISLMEGDEEKQDRQKRLRREERIFRVSKWGNSISLTGRKSQAVGSALRPTCLWARKRADSSM
jgi:hypothetical protein